MQCKVIESRRRKKKEKKKQNKARKQNQVTKSREVQAIYGKSVCSIHLKNHKSLIYETDLVIYSEYY